MRYRNFCTATLLAACALAAQAVPVSAITFSTTLTSTTSVHSTRGYAFDVTAAGVVVTHLSVWDALGDGLNEAHTVGLWSPGGLLLASAVVPAGSSAALLDGFRYVDIADVLLDIGSGYVVGATFVQGSLDLQAGELVNLSSAPGLSYVQGRFANDTGAGVLTLPASPLDIGLPGGSLLVDGGVVVAPLPEPGSALLAGLGLLLLTTALRPRRGARSA